MRLNPMEVDALRSILHGLDPNGKIYLFGSRTDDSRRGGDIDAFLDASITIELKTALITEYRLSEDHGLFSNRLWMSPTFENSHACHCFDVYLQR